VIPTASNAIRQLSKGQLEDAIRHLCATNFLVFQKVELGLELGDHHRIWSEHLATGDDVAEMAPRLHGKSTSLARAYPLWKAKYDPWFKEILLLGADQGSSVENLDKIKEMLEERSHLQHLIPTSQRDFYSRSEIKLKNGVIIRSRSIGAKLRGIHPQLIVLDDVVHEGNSLNPQSREYLLNYFNRVIVQLKDKGLKGTIHENRRAQLVVVGTPQHWEDLLHWLLENSEYRGERLPAIIDELTQSVLWEEMYSYGDLMAQKKKIGMLAFAQEFQLEPISDETSLFPPSLFKVLYDKELSYEHTYKGSWPLYLGGDFSVPGSIDKDWTVLFILAFDPGRNEFIPINYWRARPEHITDQLDKIDTMARHYKITTGYLEANMFQAVYAEHFKDSDLPITGHVVTATNKNSLDDGILSFRPLFENGQFRFPYKTARDVEMTEYLVREFAGIQRKHGKIGNEQTHDDVVMALWHAYSAAKQGSAFSVSW